ncbi:MAG: leucyl/phenylalanyl-tRNA--protein transferase [Arenimonas sp.]
MSIELNWLGKDEHSPFPDVRTALHEPDGLLAAGGDLSELRLLNAYRHGIFPWFSEGQPILWWCPDPRMVFRTNAIRLSTRFKQQLRKSTWQIRIDTNFDTVIRQCAIVARKGQRGTWIHPEMIDAYCQLHRQGHAHSVEVFSGEKLIGGIYGIAIGRMFFGESMFSLESGASKVALAALGKILNDWGWPMLDAQVENPHLQFMGAEFMPRPEFVLEVARLCGLAEVPGVWSGRIAPFAASECLA